MTSTNYRTRQPRQRRPTWWWPRPNQPYRTVRPYIRHEDLSNHPSATVCPGHEYLRSIHVFLCGTGLGATGVVDVGE